MAEARTLTTSTAEVFSMVLRPDDPLSFEEENEEEEEPKGYEPIPEREGYPHTLSVE